MVKVPRRPDPERLANTEWYDSAAGDGLWRVYFRGGAHPSRWDRFRTFGPTDARFDRHQNDDNEQAVLYVARSPVTCLAEVFQKTRSIHRRHRKPVLVGFARHRPLKLLDLTGARSVSRTWARGLYAAYPDAQGIAYPSSMHANVLAVVLNERAIGALPSTPGFHKSLDDGGLVTVLKNAARELGYALR